MNIEIFDHRGRFQYNLAQIGRLDVGDVVNVGVIHSQVLQTLEGDVLDWNEIRIGEKRERSQRV